MIVSIIIPAYNAAATIAAAIHSALNQADISYKLEIVIVNDGSTDDTAAALAKFKEQCLIITTTNQGVSAARSAGLQRATGNYIQYLDSDDLLMPGKIKQQLEVLIKEQADIAYGDWEKFTEASGKKMITETVTGQIKGDLAIVIFTDFWCPPAALLYSRKITNKLQWSNTLPVIQDARYMLDAVLAGAKIVYTPGVQAQYRTNQDSSLSQRSSLVFLKDCFTNASEVYEMWKNDITGNPTKKEALIKVLRGCITGFSLVDKSLFTQAIDLLYKIDSDYIPDNPGLHQTLSKYVGFRNAEKIAAIKRRLLK